MIKKMMIEMSKLIQNLYGLVLNQHKENIRRDEHFHKTFEIVYTNDYPQTRSARKLSDNQVATRSQAKNNLKSQDNNKPIIKENSPEQRNTTRKTPSQPPNVPPKGILKNNDRPQRMTFQETMKTISPGLAKPQNKEPMQRKQVSFPSKEVSPVIQESLNTNILGKLSRSLVMVSFKELIVIPSVRT